MTSKNLFFKLMKEDFKIRIWSLAISILSFFFSLIVATAMLISYHRNMTYSYLIEETGEIVDDSYKLVERFNFYMNIKSPLFAFVFLCLSLIVAISGFTYLYSKKKVDMYHSLPVKREVLFAVKVINGILIVIVPFIICTIIASLMIAVNASDGSVIIRSIGVALGWCVFFIFL